MSMILTLRITAEQRERWKEAANREGLTLSGWVRKHCSSGYGKQKVEINVQPKKSAAERLAEILDLAAPTD
jgi:hypothetical protein